MDHKNTINNILEEKKLKLKDGQDIMVIVEESLLWIMELEDNRIYEDDVKAISNFIDYCVNEGKYFETI